MSIPPKVLLMSACTGTNHSNNVVDQQGVIMDFVCINDSTYPLRNNALHPRMLGKIPKMLAWELYPGYDYYIWIDSQFTFSTSTCAQWFIAQLANGDAAFFAHPHDRTSILDELLFVEDGMNNNSEYLISRYGGENMRKQVEHYLQDATFADNVLIAAGAFIYSAKIVENKQYNVMKEWFYHNCIWSVQDQLSLPYLLHKFNIKYTIMHENIYACRYLQ